MNLELDLTHLEELRELYGDASPQWRELLDGVHRSLAEVIEQIEQAVAARDLADLSRAAHRGRNDALLIGARNLLGPLSKLEAAARRERLAEATRALEQLRAGWPRTRAELERLLTEARHNDP